MKHLTKRKFTQSRAGNPCHYCKRKMLQSSSTVEPNPYLRGLVATEEHIVPRSQGGGNEPSNLTVACSRCNTLRGHLDYEIFTMFAQVILTQYPDAPVIYLRSALVQFITALAQVAIRNKREARQAISFTLLKLGEDLRKSGLSTTPVKKK